MGKSMETALRARIKTIANGIEKTTRAQKPCQTCQKSKYINTSTIMPVQALTVPMPTKRFVST